MVSSSGSRSQSTLLHSSMTSNIPRYVPHYPVESWNKISKNCTSPAWTNDPEKMDLNRWSLFFNTDCKFNIATDEEIDRLGPALLALEENAQIVLKDGQGFWYFLDLEGSGMWAWEEKFTISELAAELRGGVHPYLNERYGHMVKCGDTRKIIPAHRGCEETLDASRTLRVQWSESDAG